MRWGVAIFRNANDRYEVATLNSSASGVRNELTSLALSWHATEAAARAAANVEVAHQRAHLRERGLPVY